FLSSAIKFTKVEYSCCKFTSSTKSCSSNTFSKKNSYVPWFSLGPYVLIFSSGQSGLISDHFVTPPSAKKIFLRSSAVISFAQSFSGLITNVSPSRATLSSFTSIPNSSAFSASSSFICLEASLKSVPFSTKNFSKPALVPALLTSTETPSCSVAIYSSAILAINGYTVPEPSITTLPSRSVFSLFTCSSFFSAVSSASSFDSSLPESEL